MGIREEKRRAMDELISIIVPVYNAERHLAETIACVRAQTCREWELLLVAAPTGAWRRSGAAWRRRGIPGYG